MILLTTKLENPWLLSVSFHQNVGSVGSEMCSVLPTAVVLALRTGLETEEVLGQCSMNELKNIYHIYVQRIEDDSNVTMT